LIKIDRVLLGFLDVDVGLRLTGQLVLSELVRSELVALLLRETGRVVRVSLKIVRILIDLAHVLSHVLAHVLNHLLVLLGGLTLLILIVRHILHISLSLSLLSKLSKIIVILVALSSEIILSLSKILFHLTLVLTVTILEVSLNLRSLDTGLATLDVVLTVHGER